MRVKVLIVRVSVRVEGKEEREERWEEPFLRRRDCFGDGKVVGALREERWNVGWAIFGVERV
jgi:hypothetical protein